MFSLVERKLYGEPLLGTYYKTYGREYTFHRGFDSDSGLEEGGKYEYQIVAFNNSSSKTSPIIETEILEPFSYELTMPRHNALIKKSDVANQSFTIKLSNPSVLETSDCVKMGVFIVGRKMDKQWSQMH